MTAVGFVGTFLAGGVFGYGLHLILSWGTVSGALESADEYREDAVALALDLDSARAAAREAFQLGYTAGVRAHEDVN